MKTSHSTSPFHSSTLIQADHYISLVFAGTLSYATPCSSRYPAIDMNHHTGYFAESYRPRMNGRHDSHGSSSLSNSSDDDEVSSTDSYDSELLELQAAEREWEENVRQLQLAVSVLIMPTLGKWLGRRWSYWCMYSPSSSDHPSCSS